VQCAAGIGRIHRPGSPAWVRGLTRLATGAHPGRWRCQSAGLIAIPPAMAASPPDPTAVRPPSSPAAAAAVPGAAAMGRLERMLLAAVAAVLALLLLWLRGGLHPEAPLDRLARQSPELGVALTDGRPTLVEFYADWCEACRAMAPAMDQLEQRHRGALDVVLLNVDNPRWQAELERYEVNGIPQLELFDAGGTAVGRSIGARSAAELASLTSALLQGEPLPQLPGVGATSTLPASLPADSSAAQAGPRSHG